MAKEITLESIKAKYQKIYDEKNEQRRDYLEKVETAKKKLAEASDAAEEAYRNANMTDYYKWQNEVRYNNDAISMYQRKADEIEKEPFITRKEFDELYRDVKTFFDGYVEHDRETLSKIVDGMIEIRDRECDKLIECNEFIKFAQLSLLKATNGLWRDGMLETFNVKQLNNYDGLEFVNFVCRHSFVEDHIKK